MQNLTKGSSIERPHFTCFSIFCNFSLDSAFFGFGLWRLIRWRLLNLLAATACIPIGPPKALDEDETEFLEKLEMSRKEYEQQIANEDAMQLRLFQEAVATQASVARELKETPAIPKTEENIQIVKKNPNSGPGNVVISVKPRAKKPRTEVSASQSAKYQDSWSPSSKGPADEKPLSDNGPEATLGVLVSYSDESDYE